MQGRNEKFIADDLLFDRTLLETTCTLTILQDFTLLWSLRRDFFKILMFKGKYKSNWSPGQIPSLGVQPKFLRFTNHGLPNKLFQIQRWNFLARLVFRRNENTQRVFDLFDSLNLIVFLILLLIFIHLYFNLY